MPLIRTIRTRLLPAIAGLCIGAGVCASQNSAAADMMFRRSYYSHAIPPEMEPFSPRPVSRSAYRPALVGTTPGFAIRGAHRFNTIYLRSGLSTDVTIIREDWHELTPPFVE